MNLDIDGRVAVISGGTSAIGRAVARRLGNASGRVAVTWRHDHTAAVRLVGSLRADGVDACAVELDLGDAGSIDRALDTVRETLGAPSILVHNAVEWPTSTQWLVDRDSVDTLRRSLDTNLVGPYQLTVGALPNMVTQRWGRIVFVSTGLVDDGLDGSSAYVTAKSGLHGLTRVMSRELGRFGILTNVVMPGFTQTDQERPAQLVATVEDATATGRLTLPDDIASCVAFLVSAANGHVTGERIRVDGHFLSPHVRR
ncbi:MAG: short-chain dehydrogenase [Acidimicrobiaceae bacterium]|nr:short-chain dehydrogenase [Acidimicrobiaceae bacterium]